MGCVTVGDGPAPQTEMPCPFLKSMALESVSVDEEAEIKPLVVWPEPDADVIVGCPIYENVCVVEFTEPMGTHTFVRSRTLRLPMGDSLLIPICAGLGACAKA